MLHHSRASLAALLLFAVALPVADWWSAAEASSLRGKREAPLAAKSKSSGKGLEAECLRAHNKWRRLHQAPELVFDKKIAAFAQKRADLIAKSDGAEFRHPPDLPFGENLAWHSRSSRNCADLTKMWYDEVELYDYKRAQFSHETGHFTQLVWRDTKRVGCAKAVSSGPRGGVYLVCNYDPPGNYLGEAQQNVLQRIIAPKAQSTTTAAAAAAAAAATTTTALATAPPTSTTPAPAAATATSTTVAPPSTLRSLEPQQQQQGAQTTTTKKPTDSNKNKSNGKRKSRNKNKKGNKNRNNKNKRKNKKNNKGRNKQKLESSSAAPTPASSVAPSIAAAAAGAGPAIV